LSYRVDFTPSAARAFRKLDGSVQDQLTPKINALSLNPRPHGVEKISGAANRYRIRSGDYRVIYAIEDKLRLVVVAVIAHRREVYR